MRRKALLTVVLLVALAVVLAAVRMQRMREKESAALIETAPTPVRVSTVFHGTAHQQRHLLGEVLGETEVLLAPRVTGQILSIRPREGDSVRKGEVLVLLDARELEDAVATAEARLAAARSAVEAAKIGRESQRGITDRDRVLFDAGAISAEDWERSQALDAASASTLAAAESQRAAAERALETARVRLGYASLTSPIDGRIAERLADPGALAVPGRTVLRIVPDAAVRIRCRTLAEDVSSLRVGTPVTVGIAGRQLTANVSRVFAAMDEHHLAVFEVDLPSPPPGVIAGATVGIDLHLSTASGLSVPAQALLEGEDGEFVFTVSGDRVHARKVAIVARSDDRVIVTGDLNDGDQVVVGRPSRLMTLADGSPVLLAAN